MVLAARPARRVPLARLVQPDPPDLQGLPDQPDLRVLIVRFPVLQAPLGLPGQREILGQQVLLARQELRVLMAQQGLQAPQAQLVLPLQ